MTLVGTFLLVSCLAGLAEAEAIRHVFSIKELDGSLTAMANVSLRLEETNQFVNDCDTPPCTSFDLQSTSSISVAAIDRINYTPNVLFRSEENYNASEFGDRATYPMLYQIAESSNFMSLRFQEDTNNVMTLWKHEDESPPITIFDSILMFLFGISCVIGLLGSNTPQKKRRRQSQKRRRKVRR